MAEILFKINEIIDKYESGEWISADKLRVMQRELSCSIYRLTEFNIKAFKLQAMQKRLQRQILRLQN